MNSYIAFPNRGNSLKTYSGLSFHIKSPQADEISLVDIAHALSLICRANGHFKHFYSVAQHCINCYREAAARRYSRNVQIACLFHDGSEAYISDITRPVKEYLPNYLEMESIIQNKVYEKFCLKKLSSADLEKVADVDDTVLWHEFNGLHNMPMWCAEPKIYAELDLEYRDMKKVEQEFIAIAKSIGVGILQR